MRAARFCGGVLLDAFELIEEHAGAFILLGLVCLGALTWRVLTDEAHTKSEARHTRRVQLEGAPVAVCLLDALRAAEPLLVRVASVELPLSTYVRLQGDRYPGVGCPDGR